jgi:hypothetical protein
MKMVLTCHIIAATFLFDVNSAVKVRANFANFFQSLLRRLFLFQTSRFYVVVLSTCLTLMPWKLVVVAGLEAAVYAGHNKLIDSVRVDLSGLAI